LLCRVISSVMLGLCVACSGCGGSPQDAGSGSRTGSSPTSVAAPAARDRSVTKLLVLVVENHSLDQMRQQMPYTAGLAAHFGYATDYRGVTYPSLPNYIAMTSGSTHGIADDGPPEVHQLQGPSVFGQAIARGKTAAVYADGMTANCDASPRAGDDYAVKHNPWVYYTSERGLCQKDDVPATRLAEAIANSALPNVGMVVPNLCHDAHDCDLSVADDWIRHLMGEVFSGPDWRSGHLAVVITADTDDRKESNRILTVVIHPSQRHHVVDQPLDHYTLSRLYSDVVHAPPLDRAASAPSLSDAFGLPLD
jgi:hypothetical protein